MCFLKKQSLILAALIILFTAIATPAFAREDYPEIKGIYEGAPYADIATEIRYEDGHVRVTIPKKYIFDENKLNGEVEMIIPPHWEGPEVVPGSKVKVDNYILIRKKKDEWGNDEFFVKDMYELTDGVGGLSKQQCQQRINDELETLLSSVAASMYYYPRFEMVSINGVPWQQSEWADWIISETKRRLNPGDELLKNDLLWEIYINPKYSGWAEKAYEQKLAGRETEPETSAGDQQNEQDTAAPKGDSTGARVELKLDNKEVYVYGKDNLEKIVDLTASPSAPKGHTLIPLRGVLDELGVNLAYDGSTNQVVIATDKVTVTLVPGSRTALANGAEIEMRQPAVVENDRMLVPLRFVGEQLGFDVEYNQESKTITIR